MAAALDFAALLKEERLRYAQKKKKKKQDDDDEEALVPAPTAVEKEEEEIEEEEEGVLYESAVRPPLRVVGGKLETLLYAGEFVSVEEEAALMRAAAAGSWHKCRGRSVRRLGGDAGSPGFEPQQRLPHRWARELCSIVADATGEIIAPNHVLVNRYDPKKGFILAHSDGPAYAPVTVTLSCGADVVLVFAPLLSTEEIGTAVKAPTCSVVLRRRSILVFRDAAYLTHTHAIDAASEFGGGTTTTTTTMVATAAAAAAAAAAPDDADETLDQRGERFSFTIRQARRIVATEEQPTAAAS